MTFVNEIGQISTDMNQAVALEGTLAMRPVKATSLINRLRNQTNTVTITSGSDVGTYTIVAVDEAGYSYTLASYTSGGGDNATAIAAGLVASYSAAADVYGIVNSISNNSGVVTVVFNPAGSVYTVTAPETSAGGSAAVATTVAAAGTAIPFGRAVQDVGTSVDRMIGLPSGATALQLEGVVYRDATAVARGVATDVAAPAVIGVLNDGEVWVRNQAGTASKGGQVYVVVNTAGGDELGEIRASADGGNTVAPTGWVFTSAAAAGALARIRISR